MNSQDIECNSQCFSITQTSLNKQSSLIMENMDLIERLKRPVFVHVQN